MSLTPQANQNNNLSPGRDRSPNRSPSPRPRRQVRMDVNDTSRPLLNTETVRPPLAGAETDDEPDDRETTTTQPGVDDGFFNNPNPDVENVPEKRPDDIDLGRLPPTSPRDGRFPEFPYAPGFGPSINMPDFAPSEFGGGTESIPDVNMYQHKKTLAQGMMDLALFSANANQLRYVLESFDRHPYYYPSVALISLSLIIQVNKNISRFSNHTVIFIFKSQKFGIQLI